MKKKTGNPLNSPRSVEKVRKSGTAPPPLPEKYRVTITVEPQDDSGASLTIKMEDLLRSDILDPDYRNDGIAAMVRNLDYFWYGQGKPAQEKKPA